MKSRCKTSNVKKDVKIDAVAEIAEINVAINVETAVSVEIAKFHKLMNLLKLLQLL